MVAEGQVLEVSKIQADRRVLVVEDEPMTRKLLRHSLEVEGLEVLEADCGLRGLSEAAQSLPGLVILDLGLPDIDGREVLRRLREWSSIPVIILSARGEVVDKVEALDLGAQDYVTKPFVPAELLARIRVALREHANEKSEPFYESGGLFVDFTKHKVKVFDKYVYLTPMEFSILRVLVQNRGYIVTKPQMKRLIWGDSKSSTEEQLRVHMTALRKKLRDNGIDGLIKTQYGVGHWI